MGLSLPAIRVVPLTIRAYHSTRACTERITTITLADLAHFARTPSYIAAADFLYPSFPSFFPPVFLYFFFFHRLIFQCNIGWLSLSFLLVCSSRDLEGGPEDVLGTPHSCTQRLGYKALFLSISRKVGTSEHSISSRKIFTR